VADATWSSQGGVLTTNLYGLPDREAGLRARCDRLGIPLTEGAATPPDRGRPPGHSQLGAAAFGLLKQAPPPTVGSTGRMAPLLPTQQPRVVDLEAAVFDVR
jgi:hypothetical protein